MNKVPKFKNDVEAARFWDTHDTTDFLDEFKPAYLEFPKPRHKLVVISLKPRQWAKLTRIASKKHTSYPDKIVQKWVEEKLAHSV